MLVTDSSRIQVASFRQDRPRGVYLIFGDYRRLRRLGHLRPPRVHKDSDTVLSRLIPLLLRPSPKKRHENKPITTTTYDMIHMWVFQRGGSRIQNRMRALSVLGDINATASCGPYITRCCNSNRVTTVVMDARCAQLSAINIERCALSTRRRCRDHPRGLPFCA